MNTYVQNLASIHPRTDCLTFGGMGYGHPPSGSTGAISTAKVEMILSSAISGIVYAFFAGQPTCIMGATGPELALDLGRVSM